MISDATRAKRIKARTDSRRPLRSPTYPRDRAVRVHPVPLSAVFTGSWMRRPRDPRQAAV
jgi:hypothetical protein